MQSEKKCQRNTPDLRYIHVDPPKAKSTRLLGIWDVYIPDILCPHFFRDSVFILPPTFSVGKSGGMRCPNPFQSALVAVNKAFCRDLRGVWEVSIYTVAPHTNHGIMKIPHNHLKLRENAVYTRL